MDIPSGRAGKIGDFHPAVTVQFVCRDIFIKKILCFVNCVSLASIFSLDCQGGSGLVCREKKPGEMDTNRGQDVISTDTME